MAFLTLTLIKALGMDVETKGLYLVVEGGWGVLKSTTVVQKKKPLHFVHITILILYKNLNVHV